MGLAVTLFLDLVNVDLVGWVRGAACLALIFHGEMIVNRIAYVSMELRVMLLLVNVYVLLVGLDFSVKRHALVVFMALAARCIVCVLMEVTVTQSQEHVNVRKVGEETCVKRSVMQVGMVPTVPCSVTVFMQRVVIELVVTVLVPLDIKASDVTRIVLLAITVRIVKKNAPVPTTVHVIQLLDSVTVPQAGLAMHVI